MASVTPALDAVFATARPPSSQPQLVERLRSDPRLLERVLSHHTSQPIRVSSPTAGDEGVTSQQQQQPPHQLPSACFWIRFVVRGNDNSASLRAALSRTPASVCGKKLRNGDVAFRCLTCSADNTCIFCRNCFEASPCINHEYRQLSSGGGMCDCGDPGAWKPSGFCRHHSGASEGAILRSVPAAVRAWLEPCLRHALRLVATIANCLRATPKQLAEDNESSNGRLLCMAAGSLVKEIVEIAMVSDDGRRLVSMALADAVPSSIEMVLAPIGEETRSDFAAQRKNQSRATRQRADIDDADDDDGFFDDDDDEDEEGGHDHDAHGEDEGGGDIDFGLGDDDDDTVTPEAVAEAEGNPQLQEQLFARLLQRMRRMRAREAQEQERREAAMRDAREEQERQQQQQPSTHAQARRHTSAAGNTAARNSAQHVDPADESDMLLSIERAASSASSAAAVIANASTGRVSNAAVSTLERISFVEMFMALELCPVSGRPFFSAQCWAVLRSLFDACASDLVFRKAYTRAITRLALPWASAYCRSGGLFSVAVQCLTVAPVVEEFLLPQQHISDNSTLMSSLLAASILNATQNAVTVEEGNKRGGPTGSSSSSSNNNNNNTSNTKNNNRNNTSSTGERVYQLPKVFPRQAFVHISSEAYHPLMCSQPARVASLLSRPLFRAYLAVLSMMHYNYFWRNELAPPMPRTSWDIELTNCRRIYMLSKAAGEVTRGLLAVNNKSSSSTLEAALGCSKEMCDAIFDDVALHPVCTQLEHRSAAFHSLVQLCSVPEPTERLPVHSAPREKCVALMLQRLLTDSVFFIARQERAIARSDARSRSQGGMPWTATVSKPRHPDEDESGDGGGGKDDQTIRLLQRPYGILRDKHLVGFHFPLYRLVSAVVISTLRALSSSSPPPSSAMAEYVLRSAMTSAFSKVITSEGSYSDALHNALDRIVQCHVLGAQQLDNLWKRDFAGFSPHLNMYQSIEPTYFSELDNVFLQCVAAGISTKVLSRLVLERFSYIPQDDRIDDKAVPLGYVHALRLLLTVATDPTRTCATYRGEVTARLLTRLAVQGAEVRSRLQAQCGGSEVFDEESKSAEDVFHEVLKASTHSMQRRDATVFSLTDAAWSLVPMYTAGMPASFPALARTQYYDRIGSKRPAEEAAVKPTARTGIDRHGPAFREALPVLLHEAEVCNTALFLLLNRVLSGTSASTTSAAVAQQHPLSSVLRFGKSWRSRQQLTVPPAAVCVAIDALYLATEAVSDLFSSSSSAPSSSRRVIDWPRFEQYIAAQRAKQWQFAVSSTASLQQQQQQDFTPLKVASSSVPAAQESLFSLLLCSIVGVSMPTFTYYGLLKTHSVDPASTDRAINGIDVLEALVSNSEEALQDVALSSGCVPQLRHIVAVARDYETYRSNPQARVEQLAAGGSSAQAANALGSDGTSSSAAAAVGAAGGAKPAKTAKERASAALAAMKKKKMAAANSFLNDQLQDDEETKKDEEGVPAGAAAAAVAAASSVGNIGSNDITRAASSALQVRNSGSTAIAAMLMTKATAEDNDTTLLRSVLGGDALHRYSASFIDESVCCFCHRKGGDDSQLCHLAQLNRNATESRVCNAMSLNNNSGNTRNDAAGGAAAAATTTVSLQLNFCGHFAHRKCFDDRVTFTKNGMRNTSVFRAVRGHGYLQDGEALCSICARIVSVAVPCVAAPAPAASAPKQKHKQQRQEAVKQFADQLLAVDTLQRTAMGGEAAAAAAPASAAQLIGSVVCPTVVATVLDLQLGKRAVMMREVTGLCSLVALMRDADQNHGDGGAAGDALTLSLFAPLSALVHHVLKRSFAVCSTVAAIDDPLSLVPAIFEFVQHKFPFSLLPASSETAASSLASRLEKAPIGVASFWVRLLLITAQLGTGRLSDSQMDSIAESVLRCVSTTTSSSSSSSPDQMKACMSTAANTIGFPLWSPRVIDSTSSSSAAEAASDSGASGFPTTSAAVTLGVLDAVDESAKISAAAKFLFALGEGSFSFASSQISADENNSNSNNNSDAKKPEANDAAVDAIVAAYPLPAFFRELLPKMKMAKQRKRKGGALGDDDAENKKGSNQVNDPIPDSDEEPADEEEARRMAARREMEETTLSSGGQRNQSNENDDDDDGDAHHQTTASVANSLVEASSSYVCSRCGSVPAIPVVCVFCRQVFCARGTPPELAEHSARCGGAGCGVYVQLKMTQGLVVQVGWRAQVQPSMFLDRFGEEDIGLRRGRPLQLNGERYRRFLRLCVRSAWDHSTSELEDGGTFKNVSPL